MLRLAAIDITLRHAITLTLRHAILRCYVSFLLRIPVLIMLPYRHRLLSAFTPDAAMLSMPLRLFATLLAMILLP